VVFSFPARGQGTNVPSFDQTIHGATGVQSGVVAAKQAVCDGRVVHAGRVHFAGWQLHRRRPATDSAARGGGGGGVVGVVGGVVGVVGVVVGVVVAVGGGGGGGVGGVGGVGGMVVVGAVGDHGKG